MVRQPETWAQMSPSPCSGTRTFWEMISIRISFGLPPSGSRTRGAAQLTAGKDGRRGGGVVHMPRSLPRIIGDEHVAGLHGIGRKFFEEGAHGRRQTTDEAGKTHGGLRHAGA